MRVPFLFFIFSLVAFCNASAQFVTELEIGTDAYAFHGNVQGRIKTFRSEPEAVEVVRRLMDSMGLPLRFEVRASSVPNASAILQKDGKRFILYNVIFMEEMRKKTGNYWSLISIMAHEIGHHLSSHLESQIDDHTAELEADYFSGFILGKLNASLDQSLVAMRELGSPLPSKTHPQRDDRLQAIALGWKGATANAAANPKAVENIPQQTDRGERNRTPQLASRIEYHYVGPVYPPDPWLALRTVPSGSGGKTIMEMPENTMFRITERRGKWWRAELRNGVSGWAHSNWIRCCRYADE